jgi:hydrogenase maturation protease
VLGLGNPLLGDDGAGWAVAQRVGRLLTDPAVEVDCSDRGGLSLMERLIGYDRAILIDTVSTGRDPRGTVAVAALSEIDDPAAGHLNSAHDATLRAALEVGTRLGAHLPEEILVVSIEAERVFEFSEGMSEPVEAALPAAVEQVLSALQR